MEDTYSEFLMVDGGTALFSWDITDGVLPGGLTLNATTGDIFGSPTGVETQVFTVRITDAYGVSDSQVLSITTNPAPLVIDTLALDPGTVGELYSQPVEANGGMPPFNYTWSVTAGSLPNGLALNAATGEISGTPKGGAKTYNFTVEVYDDFVTADQALSIVISRP